MSLIRHSFLPRTMFDMDRWFRPSDLDYGLSTLDIFDPFDELDRTLGRNFMWLDVPEIIRNVPSLEPKVPRKHRITLDCSGFDPKSIKTEIKDNKLIVSASEGSEAKNEKEDYTLKQFKKTYNIPHNAETDKLVSFVTSNGRLVVEMPLKREKNTSDDLLPKIEEGEKGTKNVTMNIWLPKNIDPAKVNVTCKDRDLIVQAEENTEDKSGKSNVYFYRRTTLPENTDFDSLKCLYDKNHILVNAKLNTEFKSGNVKQIPLEYKEKKAVEQ